MTLITTEFAEEIADQARMILLAWRDGDGGTIADYSNTKLPSCAFNIWELSVEEMELEYEVLTEFLSKVYEFKGSLSDDVGSKLLDLLFLINFVIRSKVFGGVNNE